MRISLRALDVYAEKKISTGGTVAHNSNPNHISHQLQNVENDLCPVSQQTVKRCQLSRVASRSKFSSVVLTCVSAVWFGLAGTRNNLHLRS